MAHQPIWQFIDSQGTFRAHNPQRFPFLYFPLVNDNHMMSSITPTLKGDIKTSNNEFLMTPVSRPDLVFGNTARNIWISDEYRHWPIADYIARAQGGVALEGGLLYHALSINRIAGGLKVQITNFVPVRDTVECMLISFTNTGTRTKHINVTSAIPLFCRSADNLRDHRHVTSLLNRIEQDRYGVRVTPVMSFDERGHVPNHTSYFVYGIDQRNKPPTGSFPTLESFLADSGSLQQPGAIYKQIPPKKLKNAQLRGKEAMGSLRFRNVALPPRTTVTVALVLGIARKESSLPAMFKRYNTIAKIQKALQENKAYWRTRSTQRAIKTGNEHFDNWLRWVRIQPALRTMYGCSFLPDFDYGRGGRGWRDLWQDCLTLLLQQPKTIRPLLVAHCSGIRIDGTNATIITDKPGVFIADRNRISRVWMDHGVWPFFTLNLYIKKTGDYDILGESTSYFRDSQLMRAQLLDTEHREDTTLKTRRGKQYKGSLIEHILVQHLTAFYNVGQHNYCRLENADWNDGLDMAADKGESVAFTAFYAYNLLQIASTLQTYRIRNRISSIPLLREPQILLGNARSYRSPAQKQAILKRYLEATKYTVSGVQAPVSIERLIDDLRKKGTWLIEHIRKNEWIRLGKNEGFYNGYYDNKGKRLEGKRGSRVDMTLTGQVFAILGGVATDEQIPQIYRAAKHYLQDKKLGAFRLNSDFGKPLFDMGRAFAFSYGDKENGAVFSHMCVMFAYALYTRGFKKQGGEVLQSLYWLATDTKTSHIYPNLPEYFNLNGEGLYSYLTGSASWYIMTLLTQHAQQ